MRTTPSSTWAARGRQGHHQLPDHRSGLRGVAETFERALGMVRRTDVALPPHGAALFEAFKAAGLNQNRQRSA
ncbi:hypothetical protein G6F65_023129 [Rhizopus arrhizus]|nr:hypothetical protein G6F65_023129 [Rhizopus arrhizus]